MKRLIVLFLCLTILSGCQAVGNNSGTNTETDSHVKITVNMPSDDTVNGYRDEDYVQSGIPDIISVEDVVPSAPPASNENSASFIGNSSSHIFHKPDCSSAENMKDGNKVTFESRDEAVVAGYTPCKRCSP